MFIKKNSIKTLIFNIYIINIFNQREGNKICKKTNW
jgi:hypothetical protein